MSRRIRELAESNAASASAIAGFQNYNRPPPDNSPAFRKAKADFKRGTDELAFQNRWMAAPVLAAAALPLASESAGLFAARGVAKAVEPVLAVPEAVTVLDEVVVVGRPALTEAERNVLRKAGRLKWDRANGVSSRQLFSDIHHSDPLEWAHLKPGADPNRLANLWALRPEAHDIATNAWAAFRRELGDRVPTQAELMKAKLEIDEMVQAYLRRAGVSRTRTPRRDGSLL